MAYISGAFVVVVVQALVVTFLIYHAANILHNIFFHPLRLFPGPPTHAASRLPYTYNILLGRLPFHVAGLHARYGPVVRVAPDELAFADPGAWRDVMGGGGRRDMAKWEGLFRVPEFLPPHLQNTTDREHHRALRRAVAPGFSDASLRAQEGMVRGYVELLVRRLRGLCGEEKEKEDKKGDDGGGGGAVVDLELWYRYVVFDIICDLALGQSFGCLEGSDFHPWVRGITDTGRAVWLLVAAGMYPVARWLSNTLFQAVAKKGFEVHLSMVRPIMEQRVQAGTGRPDLINPLIEKKDEWNLTPDDMISHATVFVGAGSETTAGTLAGVTSYLLEHPKAWERITREVRSSFSSSAEISLDAVNSRLPFLVACLEETMRLYPQTGVPSLRITGDTGDTICGLPIPPKTVVGIWTWSLYRDPKLFLHPNEFHPERWLGDPEYAHDVREAFKHFNTGTRDCIGKGLATMEMRLILARMVYDFDMRLEADSHNWSGRQKNLFVIWERGPLHVAITPVVRT